MISDQAECVFCAERAELATFARSSGVRALVNRAPVFPGHTLVIPERHVRVLADLELDEFVALFAFGRRVTEFLCGEFKTESFDWTIQNGEPAGQTVDHVHLHVIPRHEHDVADPGDWYPRLNDAERKAAETAFESGRVTFSDAEQQRVANHLASEWTARDSGRTP